MNHGGRNIDDYGIGGSHSEEGLYDDECALDVGFEAWPPIIEIGLGNWYHVGEVGGVADQDVDFAYSRERGLDSFLVGDIGDEGQNLDSSVCSFDLLPGSFKRLFCAAGDSYRRGSSCGESVRSGETNACAGACDEDGFTSDRERGFGGVDSGVRGITPDFCERWHFFHFDESREL